MTFAETAAAIVQRYDAGDYAAALELTDEAANRFPERPGTTALWRACLLARLDRSESALTTLENGLAAGHWWAPAALEDPDLEPLRPLERFRRVVEACADKAAEARAEPKLFVALPDRPGPHPLLLVLHGRSGSGSDTLENWRLPGWIVAAPQSSQPTGSDGGFCWDDRDRALAEVAEQLVAVRVQHEVDGDRIVVGGFSQGGELALRLALSGALPATRFVVAAPSVRESEALLALARDRTVPGTILVGDQDFAYPGVRTLADGLGDSCTVKVYEGLGHLLPPTFTDDLPAALTSFMRT